MKKTILKIIHICGLSGSLMIGLFTLSSNLWLGISIIMCFNMYILTHDYLYDMKKDNQ